MRWVSLVTVAVVCALAGCGGGDAPKSGPDAGDPGDGTCACNATGPACTAWLANNCSGTPTCPAKLADAMQADTWGARTSTHLDTTYSECSDGTTWFTDQGFEYAMTLEFDATGTLVYEANQAVGGAYCGSAVGGDSASGVTCVACDVLGAKSDLPACAVDDAGTLALP